MARGTILLARWLGEAAALAAAITSGLSVGGVMVIAGNGTGGLSGFVFFIAASIVLGVIFLSVAAAIASMAVNRVVALGDATFTWFFFVLLL